MMRRRRRRSREIAFGLDSFLDVIANVIGIIIRMILVVWVGARSYHELQFKPKLDRAPPSVASTIPPRQALDDPLEKEIAAHRQQLQQVQQSLLEHLRQLPPLAEKQKHIQQALLAVAAQRQALEQSREGVQQAVAGQKQVTAAAELSLSELQQRSLKLQQELARLNQSVPPKKAIQYRTPVSRKVETEELFFECRAGRATFIDIATMVRDMQDDVKSRIGTLKQFGKVEGVTRQVGAFRLNYTLTLDPFGQVAGTGEVDGKWVVEPLSPLRGETPAQALQPTSEFRQIVDFVDRKQTVVTFWVYPDSFPVFRQLRDYLYSRDIEVAARPLPEGYPISASRHGSASRSQ